jgi:hypothetical protein
MLRRKAAIQGILPHPASAKIAAHVDMDRMTMLRRIKEATGTMSKGRAGQEAAAGNWPPKRRLQTTR